MKRIFYYFAFLSWTVCSSHSKEEPPSTDTNINAEIDSAQVRFDEEEIFKYSNQFYENPNKETMKRFEEYAQKVYYGQFPLECLKLLDQCPDDFQFSVLFWRSIHSD